MKKFEEKGNFMKKKMFFGLLLIMGGITNCVSIQDLIDKNALPAIDQFGQLELADMGITSLEGTENIPGHEKIRRVYLGSNKLTFIPGKIKGFENVEMLFLWDNEITKMPGKIEGLGNLKVLNLSKNKLTGMPNEIKGLQGLEDLSLAENKFTRWPIGIWNFLKLKTLDIRNNLNMLPKLELIEYEDDPEGLTG